MNKTNLTQLGTVKSTVERAKSCHVAPKLLKTFSKIIQILNPLTHEQRLKIVKAAMIMVEEKEEKKCK